MTEISRRSAIALGAAAGLATFAEGAFATDAPKSTKDMPMKHTELALSKEECLYIIEHTDHAVLSTADATGEPYGVPVTPFYAEREDLFPRYRNGRRPPQREPDSESPRVALLDREAGHQ